MAIFKKLINIINELDSQIESNEDLDKAAGKLIECIDGIEFDAEDIISAIIDNGESKKDYLSLLNKCLIIQHNIFTAFIDKQSKIMQNDLKFILGDTPEQLQLELISRTRESIKTIKTFELISVLMKHYIKELNIYSNVSPKIDRKLKGKIPKAKKQAQIDAEEWAKDIWSKHPESTQESVAIAIKDGLDLTQTIQTIINWIKPHQPKKKKK